MFLRDTIWGYIKEWFTTDEHIAIYDSISSHIVKPQGVILDLKKIDSNLKSKLLECYAVAEQEINPALLFDYHEFPRSQKLEYVGLKFKKG